SDVFPAPELAYKSTTRWATTNDSSSRTSRSRPKKNGRSPRSYGRGPRYGFPSRSGIRRVKLVLAQLVGKVERGSPVDLDPHRVEVLLEVVAGVLAGGR